MTTTPNYALIWQECGENSPYAQQFYVPGFTGYLPFFVDGAELDRVRSGQPVELREVHLLKGILYGLHGLDEEKARGKDTLLHLLDVLRRGFGFQTADQMILDVAGNARSEHGTPVSFVMLQVGYGLIPESSPIMSDLICDTWDMLASHGELVTREDELRRIVDLIHRVDMAALVPEARQIIAYFGFTALVLLGRGDEVPSYLETFIYPYVTHGQLKLKIKAMLEDPQSACIEPF